MLLLLSLIPKDFKSLLIVLNSPLIHLGKDAIKRIIPLKIYAIALNEPLMNVCTRGNLMPTMLNKIVTPVMAINTVIQAFRISITDNPDNILTTKCKNNNNITFPPIVEIKIKKQ